MSAHRAFDKDSDAGGETDGPGRRLRVVRQNQGLTVDTVAADLHLSTAIIQALEHDDYDTLPGQVFVSGYIRKYGRLLDLDPEPLVAAYRSAVRHTQPTSIPAPPSAPEQIGAGHWIMRLSSAGILVLLVGLAYVWWQGRQAATAPAVTAPENGSAASEDSMAGPVLTRLPKPTPPSAADPEPSAAPDSGRAYEPAQTASIIAPPAAVSAAPQRSQTSETSDDRIPVTDRDEDDRSHASTATPASNEAATVSVAVAAPQPESAAAEPEIVLSFDGLCWVDVRDSARKYKLFGEMKKGDRHVLQGEPPYKITLGNAAAVRLTVGGETFDLTAVSRGNVARFTLDPTEIVSN